MRKPKWAKKGTPSEALWFTPQVLHQMKGDIKLHNYITEISFLETAVLVLVLEIFKS